MAVRLILAQSIKTCDACGKEGPFRTQSHWKLARAALDYQGSVCADATVELDLCDDCQQRLSNCLNSEVERIKQENP